MWQAACVRNTLQLNFFSPQVRKTFLFEAALCRLQLYLNNGTIFISGLLQCVDMQPAACWPPFNAPCGHDKNGYFFSHFNFQMSFIRTVCFLTVNCVAKVAECNEDQFFVIQIKQAPAPSLRAVVTGYAQRIWSACAAKCRTQTHLPCYEVKEKKVNDLCVNCMTAT